MPPDPAADRVIDEAVRLARQASEPRLLAAAALLNAQHLDFNAPAEDAAALLREAAAALDPADAALRGRTLARLAIALAAAPAEALDAAERAVAEAREAVTRDPDDRAAATALAAALSARHYVRWGSQEPADALAAADEIVAAAQRAREPETELDGRVVRLAHLPELDRLAGSLRQPAARLAALSRRSTLAALTGDFAPAAELAGQAFQTGQAAGLPDAGAVYWGQLFAIWLHTGLPDGDEQWMERELRDLVARSRLSVAHAAALVQVEAAHGAAEQAHGRLDELVSWAWMRYGRTCCSLGAGPARPLLRGPAGGPARAAALPGNGPVRDRQARAAYRQRLADLDEELAEAERWNDAERASRLRAETDFLVRELTAATGLGGRPRAFGSESERARINVTRAIRTAIGRIRDRAPAAAVHLDQAVRTGTRCSYSPVACSPGDAG